MWTTVFLLGAVALAVILFRAIARRRRPGEPEPTTYVCDMCNEAGCDCRKVETPPAADPEKGP